MKFRKLFLILIFISCFFFVKTGVNAVTDGDSLGTVSGGGCNNSYCYTNDIGIRITVVDANGDRCEYKDNKIKCGEGVNPYSHSKAKSIDYWFTKDISTGYRSEAVCKAYKTKQTKKEFISGNNRSSVEDCINDDSSSIVSLFGKSKITDIKVDGDKNWTTHVAKYTDPTLGTVPEGEYEYNSAQAKSRYVPSNSIEYVRNPININRVINYLECTMLSEDSNKFGTTDKLTSSYCGSVTRDSTIIQRIFRNAFEEKDLDISKLNLGDVYLQIEQIVAFSSLNGPVANYTFVGSVAEVSDMYQNYNGVGKQRWALVSNGKKFNSSSGVYDVNGNRTAAICTGIFDGWSNKVKKGTGLNNIVESKRPCSSIPWNGFDLGQYRKNDTRNVISFWVNPDGVNSCNKDARNEILIKKYDDINEFIEYLKRKYSSDYEATNTGNNKINIFEAIKDISKTGINRILNNSVINSDDYCKAISCENILDGLKDSGKVNEGNLNILYNTFPKNDFLNPEVLKELGDTSYSRASCESIPNCPVDPKVFKCDDVTGNSLTLSDSTASNSNGTCISQGIAYNGYEENNTFHKEAVQSSYDSEYGTPGDPGYCSEKVTFDFPGNASATAGKLLKWGKIEDDQEFREFGTMTVHRTCYLSESKKKWDADKKVTITSNWADVKGSGFITANNYGNIADEKDARINPIIELNYVQAVPEKYRDGEHQVNNYRVKENLKVYLSKFVITDDQNVDNELNDVEYDINGNVIKISDDNINDGNNPRTTTLNKDSAEAKGIDMIKYVDMTATYKIVYDNNLYWYSDKSNQFALTTTNDEDAMAQNPSYVALGYGLPTSFLTPSTPIDKHYGYALNSSESGGKLSVSVSQIGTQNSTGGKYHFDKMITYALDDDDNDNNDKIVYSCGFNIQNELFGYECGDHGEKCSSTCDEPPCDSPKGIDVVFRTVDLVSSEEDLTMAFPGRSGKGRQRGKNWAELDDEEVVDILNNNIYNNTPIYEINLNSSLIQNIRLANKNMRAKGNDPYSDMTLAQGNGSEGDGYQGYTYYQSKGDNKFAKCMEFFSFFTDSSKFRECMSSPSESESSSTTGPVASNFIKHLIEKGSLTGRCATQSDNSRRIENILSGCEG